MPAVRTLAASLDGVAAQSGRDGVAPAWGQAWEQWLRTLAATPFDTLRAQYAAGVRSGVWPASLLEASRFERRVAGLESLLLGPWARGR